MGPGVDRGSARPAGRYSDAGAAGRDLAGSRAPRREPEPHDDGLRAYPAGPGAAGGPRQLPATRNHPGVMPDQAPTPEPESRERARRPALRGYRSQPPTDPDPRNGPSQAAVLRPVPPWTATHQPWAGPCRPELCWNGGEG